MAMEAFYIEVHEYQRFYLIKQETVPEAKFNRWFKSKSRVTQKLLFLN